jgi:hypothetical protein
VTHADPFLFLVRMPRKAVDKMIARTGEIPEREKYQRNKMIDEQISTFSKVLQLNSANALQREWHG